MREPRKEKPTIDMCYYRNPDSGDPCVCTPAWKLKGDKYRFKVCDGHLAWGIRLSGLPALVDKYEPNSGMGQFEEVSDPSLHKDYSNKPTLVGKRPTPLPPK
jgi:hypothetical protein